MTAKQQINDWLEANRNVSSETERQALYSKIRGELAQKQGAELEEGLLALKESVKELHQKVDQQLQPASIEVFPKNEADVSMLEVLFKRLNIPYRLTA